ncbi:ubiquinol-cytochrome c reductase iron-sulfur subunit [Cryptosporangium aurantiacum]|uniref:Cytochrome bc1 complex Rieske iron-sulfur subunit n=1 Tax=Cryptosporangium aurantiacum TaxID=134849 RepID=A0A1M7R7J8_9ACTN|nr:Rieske 2Fe-2S domain-containing protein [Cryptosporangium aurantiacum]SHN42274.1 menaquinol-cytochrome c reductase iron-sulfur subunit precursor [Cryptosporangium aurantiacum]
MSEHGSGTPVDFDPTDPKHNQFDLVREGARRDGVEIVHYQPRFAVAGTKREKRIERTIAFLLILTGLAALAFIVVYVAWPYEYEQGRGPDKLYTPLLGFTMGTALFALGAAIIVWVKKLMPEEVAVQDRHDNNPNLDERALTAATIMNMVDETGIKRRPLLKGALAVGAAPLGLMAIVPLGALIKDPHGDDQPLWTTGFKEGVRLVRDDGTPIRPGEVSAGGLETVFPGIPHGTGLKYADSPTLLIHLREEDAREFKPRKGFENAHYGNYFAYSKICTHAGCPASLFEQQTNRLLCPCHQSQFDVKDSCRPIFGPATRRLPQLPITVDEEGYFVAQSDFKEAVGPAFWERP